MTSEPGSKDKARHEAPKERLTCGIVIPISALDGCTEAHWADVLAIHSEAIGSAGFEPRVVSSADEVGIIHKRIIQNLYDNPIVVCDVSGKNPNVMFELGLRLAFDKPTIIVKDEKTSFTFDTAAIEHLEYPRDLRFSRIVDFKVKLADKIQATHKKATTDNSYTTFLKHFGEFTVAKLDKREVTGQEYLLEEMRSMRALVQSLMSTVASKYPIEHRSSRRAPLDLDVCMGSTDGKELAAICRRLLGHTHVLAAHPSDRGEGHFHVNVIATPGITIADVEMLSGGRVLEPGEPHGPARGILAS